MYITDKGGCRSKEGKTFPMCIAYGFKSKDECQAACISLELCLAINYYKVSQKCLLITTSKPTNGCPKYATWSDMGGIFAKSADDLKEHLIPDAVCYAKIQVDKR